MYNSAQTPHGYAVAVAVGVEVVTAENESGIGIGTEVEAGVGVERGDIVTVNSRHRKRRAAWTHSLEPAAEL